MINKKKYFTSWSGGKDSALAHYQALQEGGKPAYLLTMFEENEEFSRSHALPLSVLEAQAEAMEIPLLTRGASWQTYEEKFLDALSELQEKGVSHGVFGDIDLEDHLTWVQRTCEKRDVTSYHPLWQKERRLVVEQLIDAGFEAVIVVVKEEKLPSSFLGKTLTEALMHDLESFGVDPCGEEGEFHTVVVNGPLFKKPLPFITKEVQYHEGYAFLQVDVEK
ncbi:diphthine--ammonia ligase [Alkalicoccus daliensis]|uniref:MJ0570-related uncharacterized domain-containing protein n=1 Tax=Alkalicoccus daliensis TaxID=745820 RepID=A0A1H0FPG1_9BACI|nr:diphthine--ammonia ligase [Alkalicoccus daliensis]SDN96553.1 MJ0570-related uncharacterized domain-containing protein [Alkalicoccus daliensis]